MKLFKVVSGALVLFLAMGISSCKYDATKPDEGCYPDEIGNIIVPKCATPGCHNFQSKAGAGGFNFSSWNTMFQGGDNGSAVFPYRPDQSFMMYFINTYPDLGLQLVPNMPNNGTPLTHAEVVTIKNWIQNGAPDCNGHVWFSDNSQRKKFYVSNQGCDIVTVFDSQTRLPMRVINVGTDPSSIEVPHSIRVSPDGNYWYVVFTSGQVIQKFRTSDDGFEGQVALSAQNYVGWSSIAITSDSHYAFVVEWTNPGLVTVVDLQTMTRVTSYGPYSYPHGSAISSDSKTLYVTAQSGNCVHKINTSIIGLPDETLISLEPGKAANENSNTLLAHQVAISPDGTKYYVTCQYSNDVRVMNVANDSLLAIIPTGGNPQELVFSKKQPYLFVSCLNDSVTFPGSMGSISIINYQTNTLIKSVFSGWQPHGLDLDDDEGMVYIANRDVTTSGPAPHHTSTCGGRNGYITIIDMNTLNLLPGYKIEVSVDPYEVAARR